MPPDLLGPSALLIGALIAVGVLWRAHEASDREVRIDRDYWRQLALSGTDLATLAVKKRIDDA